MKIVSPLFLFSEKNLIRPCWWSEANNSSAKKALRSRPRDLRGTFIVILQYFTKAKRIIRFNFTNNEDNAQSITMEQAYLFVQRYSSFFLVKSAMNGWWIHQFNPDKLQSSKTPELKFVATTKRLLGTRKNTLKTSCKLRGDLHENKCESIKLQKLSPIQKKGK